MNKKDFLKAIRQDGATFRADKITIDTRNGKISGKGTVRISNNRFLFDVTIDEPANVPIITTGIFGRSQFWIVSGRIEDNIEFHFEGVPSGYTDHYGHHSWKVMHFSSSIMDLDPCGWDQLTIPEQKSVLKEITEKTLLEPGQPLKTVSEDDISTMRTETNAVDVWFEARLLDFKLIAFNGQTTITVTNAFLGSTLPSVASDTFHGEFQDWKFGLIQREKDLEIYFRSKVGYKSQSDESDQKLFRAFLDAVAFAHGQHCWPFLMEHRRDGKLIQDRIHLTSDVAQTAHTPFTQAFVFNEHVTKSQWQFSNPLEKAYIFFSTDSKLSRQVARLLYLFREATKSGVPKDVVLLILCSLFESLLHAAYDEE